MNIMVVGVGGQGTLLTSRIIGKTALAGGYDVKLSEVHGMAQRGGSVVTYVRFGDKVYSPIVDKGECDYIVAFEKIEAARYASYLKADGKIIVNTQEIEPMPVITGACEYPSDALEKLSALGLSVDALDALTPAIEAGSAKAVNILLMGRLSKYMDIPKEKWIEAIKKTVAPKFVELNLKAFALGRN
jgi:indolepyruvate ferredoxin oxidoreductase beta subunit